ncbi:MAG: hypothetical protein ACT4PY_08875 [Armatimonadota bacterium]
MPEAVLFSQMSPDADWEDEFNEWYNLEHVPSRLAVPGFVGASRYVAAEGWPKYAVVYYLTGLHVLETPAYQQLKREPGERTARMLASVRGFTRYVAEEITRLLRPGAPGDANAASYLYTVLFAVPPDDDAEFNHWYDEEHCRILLRNRHWWQIRRYRVHDSTPVQWTHLALHYLEDLSALDSPERREARATPWRAHLAARPWFRPEYAVYTQLPPVSA